MRFLFIVLAALGVFPALYAQPGSAPKAGGLDKAKLEAYVRQVELLPAQMTVKIGDAKPSVYANFMDLPVEVTTPNGVYALHYFLSADGKYLLKGNLFDTAKPPFESERKQLKTAGSPNFGTPGAPLTIVVFSDFQCPNCKEEAKVIHEEIPKAFPNEAWVFFKNFPLESIHNWAKNGAIAGRCIFREKPAAFWEYHDWVYQNQAEITADNFKSKVLGWAETKGIDGTKLGQCIDTRATEKDVEREVAEGRALGVNGTPTIFINGRAITGAVPWPTIEQILKIELDYAKKTAKDEKCCEVTIPSAVK